MESLQDKEAALFSGAGVLILSLYLRTHQLNDTAEGKLSQCCSSQAACMGAAFLLAEGIHQATCLCVCVAFASVPYRFLSCRAFVSNTISVL